MVWVEMGDVTDLVQEPRDPLELWKVKSEVVNVGHLHGHGLDLRELLQDELLGEELGVLDAGGEHAGVGGPGEHLENGVTDCGEHRVKVESPDVVVLPVRGHDGGEQSILGVRKGSELIIHEVDEGWLRCLEDAEVPEAGTDLGKAASGKHNLGDPREARHAVEGVAVLPPLTGMQHI